ncbi:MAG: hypothetical protein E6767_13945 [Dysgonomonas sp.]|nr:hypothetical protein [Dysgonomonas sp.]
MKLLKTTLMAFMLLSSCILTACSNDDENPLPTPETEETIARLDELKVRFGNRVQEPLVKFNYDEKDILKSFTVYNYSEEANDDNVYQLENTASYSITHEAKAIIINAQNVYHLDEGHTSTNKYKLTLDNNNRVIEKAIYAEDNENIDEIFTYIWSGNKITKIIYGDPEDEYADTYSFAYTGNNVQIVSNSSRNDGINEYRTTDWTLLLHHNTANENLYFQSLPLEYIFMIDKNGDLLAPYMSDNEITKTEEEDQYKHFDGFDRLLEDRYNKNTTEYTYNFNESYPSEIASTFTVYHKTINITDPSFNEEITSAPKDKKIYPSFSLKK